MDSNWHEDKLGAIWTVRRVARNILLVAFWTALFAVFGIAYLSIAATEYTADATVIVVFDNERTGNEDRLQAELETHRSLISSDASLVAVLGRIDIDLPAQSDGFAVKTIDSIRRMLSREPLVPAKGRTQSGADDAEGIYPAQFRRIAPAIRERLEIERIGQSRLLRLSYSASSAEAAVAFVNALAQVYSELSALPLAAGDKGQLTREPTGVAPSDPADKEMAVDEPQFRRVVETVGLSSVESTRIAPNIGVVFAVFIMLGLVVGISLAIRREYTRLT